MNIYLDTATEDFVLFLFNDKFEIIDKIILKGYRKKVELITNEYYNILTRNNLQTVDLAAFYTNIGPGFFTGVRSSLVFFRTIAMVLNKKIFYCNTFAILEKQTNDEDLFLDAQGNKQYFYKRSSSSIANEKTIKVIDAAKQSHKIDFEQMAANFPSYKDIFQTDELLKIEPLYIKKPQIGGK